MLTLKVKKRDPKSDLKTLRSKGEIPAVFYGYKKDTTPISIEERDFNKIWEEAGETTAIKLATKDGEVEALIHDVQVDVVKGNPIHADFLAIDMNKPVQANIPIELVGDSPAVKTGLGTLVKVLHELHIEALPKELPNEITIDISKLETLEDHIAVKDVTLPSGVTSLLNEDDVVVSVAAIKEETEEEAGESPDLASIEVEKRGKAEEEGETASETKE
ncbi:50S ribosomal protein L25 [Candidatus Wolfebacteria bacterium]|nr:MAG: 50S ribosomal protein L25 [Candidatus Wolfebacteria bacterium]